MKVDKYLVKLRLLKHCYFLARHTIGYQLYRSIDYTG